MDGVRRHTEIRFDPAPSAVEVEERRPEPVLHRSTTFLPEGVDTGTVAVYDPSCAHASWDLTLMPGKPLSLTFHILVSEEETTPRVEPFDQNLAFSLSTMSQKRQWP